MDNFKPKITLVALLWVTYIVLLYIIDYILLPTPAFLKTYYLVNLLAAIFVLLISIFLKVENRAYIFYKFFVIALLTLLPIILSKEMVTIDFKNNSDANSEIILLRNFPLMLMALIMLVTEYGFISAVIFSGVIPLFLIVIYRHRYVFLGTGLRPFGFLIFIQIVTFLLLGYFVNSLVKRLREQNRDLKLANLQLRDLSATREEFTISRERTRMARELHDTLAHSLSALSVQLETAKAYNKIDMETTGEIIENSLDITRLGLQETRDALKALRVTALEELGFYTAMEKLIKDKSKKNGLMVNMELPIEKKTISLSMEQCLYRVTQEAINNIITHANAKHVTIKLDTSEEIFLLIEDDGIGFNLKNYKKEGHYGLDGIKERIKLIGGTIDITSSRGRGTSIKISIKETV